MDEKIFYSKVSKECKQQKLLLSMLLAVLGIFLWFYGALILSPPKLTQWGFLLFFTGLFLIGAGLTPYRKLCRLEEHPARLVLNPLELRHYSRNKAIAYRVAEIQNVTYVQRLTSYGIELSLKKGKAYLPYFSKYTAAELLEAIKAGQE